MATGERRVGISARRGMTVLGKIPAVPKPINLPSQRLENRGLDPSVEIVPRGTFSWGTGRSPPTNSSSGGSVGLSPPVTMGAWNTVVQPSDNVGGATAQNLPRPLSAGSTRPSSAGTTRPLSASTVTGRAWGVAPKSDEQLQPSRFNLATVDFPTLGSEKNPNLRPQQNVVPSNRPTSADASQERSSAHTGTLMNRPTSADGSKERKPVYPGVEPADRPTSADGSHVDKARHLPDMRLPTFPPFYVDGISSGQRRPVHTGVVGPGTVGPGPGPHGQFEDNHNFYPPLVQHRIALPGSHMIPVGDMMHPGTIQQDRYFNSPRPLHGNFERGDVLVLPMDNRPGVYNAYPFNMGSNHLDNSSIHHPPAGWGPTNHFDRSGVYQSHSRASGLVNHSNHGMTHFEQQRPYRIENVMQHDQANRIEGFNTSQNNLEEQMAGWPGQNVVYVGPSLDSRAPPVPTPLSGRELQKPGTFTASVGSGPHSDWDNTNSGDLPIGVGKGGAPPAIHESTRPEDGHREGGRGQGTEHAGEIRHSVSLRGPDISIFGNAHAPVGASATDRTSQVSSTAVNESSGPLKQSLHLHNREETSKIQISESGLEVLKRGHDTWVNLSPPTGSGSSSLGLQPLKSKQEDERNSVEVKKESESVGFVSNMAHKRQEDSLQGTHRNKNVSHIADIYGSNGPANAAKLNPNLRKQSLASQKLAKGNKQENLPPESEESHGGSKTSLSKASEVNGSKSSGAATSSGKEHNNDVPSGIEVSSDVIKEASANTGLNGASRASHAKSPPITHSENACERGQALQTAKSSLEFIPIIPPFEEEGQALNDGANMKGRRNAHSSRRPHQSRSANDPHSVDKLHVNQGMVWAPVKTPALEASVEEKQPSTEEACKPQESMQHTASHNKPMQSLHRHLPSESRGQRHLQQVQQMQSVASSQQEQSQEHPVAAINKKQPLHTYHQKVDISSKHQGQRMQQQQQQLSRTKALKEPDQWVQQEQAKPSSYRKPNLESKQSVVNNYPEQGELHVSGQRDPNVDEVVPGKGQQEKASESRPGSVVDGRKNRGESTIYVPRPARNQQWQGPEQEQEQGAATATGQRLVNKGERSIMVDEESQPTQTSSLSVAQANKNNDESRFHQSRFSKQQKKQQHESSTMFNAAERHASTRKKPPVEEKIEQSMKSNVIPLVPESEGIEESRSLIPKAVRHQEMEKQQSAAGSHHEHNLTVEEHVKPFVQAAANSTGSEVSMNKNEMKLYVPKHRKQLSTNQQEYGATAVEGQKSQGQVAVHLSNEKDQQHMPNSPSIVADSTVKKSDIELYTPKPARQPLTQGHQSVAQGHRRQKNVVEGHAVKSPSFPGPPVESSNKEVTRHDVVSDLVESQDVRQSTGSGNKDDNQLHAPYEACQGKREVKFYVAKGSKQQQLQNPHPDQGHTEVLMTGERPSSEVSHQMPGLDSSKRKSEMKRYTPKPARQQKPAEPSPALEGKKVKDTGEVSISEQQEQNGSENDGRVDEFQHGHRNRNTGYKPRKFPQPQIKPQQAPEDGTVDDHNTWRAVEANEAVISRDHVKDVFHQKRGSRPKNHDLMESSMLEETEVGSRPRHYQKQHYQYQPVMQSVKAGGVDSNVDYEHKLNTRQQDYHGQNRRDRREGPARRDRYHGYGYRAADQTG